MSIFDPPTTLEAASWALFGIEAADDPAIPDSALEPRAQLLRLLECLLAAGIETWPSGRPTEHYLLRLRSGGLVGREFTYIWHLAGRAAAILDRTAPTWPPVSAR